MESANVKFRFPAALAQAREGLHGVERCPLSRVISHEPKDSEFPVWGYAVNKQTSAGKYNYEEPCLPQLNAPGKIHR